MTLPDTSSTPAARRRDVDATGISKLGSNSRKYVLARLERNGRHDLAEQLRAGAITAAFAASTGGFGRVPLTPLEELAPGDGARPRDVSPVFRVVHDGRGEAASVK